MKWTLFTISFAVLVVAGCSKPAETTNPAEPNKTAESLYPKVQATLTKSCVGCHGATNPKEGINLTSYESVMKGGEEGPIVVAGDAEKSVLAMSLRGTGGIKKMPLNGEPLTEDQIKEVEDWIKAGAKQ